MSSVDEANIAFWDELCGTGLADMLGIADASPASLQKFDDWYFGFYPYLLDHVPAAELANLDVLEIGLGYGSLSQKIVGAGARYVGLDIAAGPVEMARHRLRQAGLHGEVMQGSILDPPFSGQSFDRVVTIGCLHHTGDMKTAIDQCWRLLRPGGSLTLMVYYAYSYRRWWSARRQTLRYLLSETLGYRGVMVASTAREKWDYDHNRDGAPAPHTDFISVKSLRAYCNRFSEFRWQRRNIDQERPFERHTRQDLLASRWPKICGLEIYATAVK